MSRTDSQSLNAPPRVIRVLAGLDRRDSRALETGEAVRIGHAFFNDIVLRDPTVRGQQVQLSLGPESAELTVLEGEAFLLGFRLEAPASVALQPYLPLVLGKVTIAFGEPASERWREAERLLAAAHGEAPPPSSQVKAGPITRPGRAVAWLGGGGRGLGDRAKSLVAPVLVLAAIGLCSLAGQSAAIGVKRTPPPVALGEVLRRAGFADVTVSRTPDGRDLVGGRLADAAGRDRLLKILNGRRVPFRLTAKTGDDLAREAEDVFQGGGVAATVRPAGGDRFVVAVDRGEDPAWLDLLRRRALQSVTGIGELSVVTRNGDLNSGDIQDISGKKIVHIVGGGDGYVSTKDGSRYFVGANLPTGQRIMMITATDVLLEKDGTQSKLSF